MFRCKKIFRNYTALISLNTNLMRLRRPLFIMNQMVRCIHTTETVLVNRLEVSVVMNGSKAYSKSLYIRADKHLYLFNCGEDTQRLLPEVLSSDRGLLKNIFITYNSWTNVGGLVGLLLSVNWFNRRKSKIHLHGPSNVGEILKVMKYFSDHDVAAETNLEVRPMSWGQFKDSNLTVSSVELSPTSKAGDRSRLKKSIAYLVSASVPCHQKSRLATKYILVLECPTVDYLESLDNLYKQMDRQPDLVIHMSPLDVISNTLYRSFLDRLSDDNTRHLLMNEATTYLYRCGTAELVSQLHNLHPGLFPLLSTPDEPHLPSTVSTHNTIPAEYGLTISLNDEDENRRSGILKTTSGSILNDNTKMDVDLKLLKQKMEQAYENMNDGCGEFPEITFLGTGAFQHSGRRNVSATLLQTRKDEYLLLDCGEGTLSQLYQLYGSHVPHILENLKAVFISHLHYDHHGGLFGLVEARRQHLDQLGRRDKLLVLSPNNYRKWISLYSQNVQEIYSCIQLIPHHFVDITKPVQTDRGVTASLRVLKEALHVKEYTVVPVVHTVSSHGLVITHQDGWKLVYSGDTRPATSLIKHGNGCDILIHEATFSHADQNLAVLAKHSTIEEAIEVGCQMRAQFILLTHFGHKFPINPSVTEQSTNNIGCAVDFMKVGPKTLPIVPLLRPALEVLFQEKMKSNTEPGSTSNDFEEYLVNLYRLSANRQRIRNKTTPRNKLRKLDGRT